MANEENITEEANGGGNGRSVVDALKSKELLLPAALSAVGAVAAAKGPDLVRRLTDATEEKGEERAERLGRKAAEGATSGVEDKVKGMGAVGKVASFGPEQRAPPRAVGAVPVRQLLEIDQAQPARQLVVAAIAQGQPMALGVMQLHRLEDRRHRCLLARQPLALAHRQRAAERPNREHDRQPDPIEPGDVGQSRNADRRKLRLQGAEKGRRIDRGGGPLHPSTGSG